MALIKHFIVFLMLLFTVFLSSSCSQSSEIKLSELPAYLMVKETPIQPEAALNLAKNDSTSSPPLSLKVATKIPKLLKAGGSLTLDLEVKNAVGAVFFFFQFQGVKKISSSKKSTIKVFIPNIKQCDRSVALKLTAEDESGKTAHKTIILNISQTWCTYNAEKNALLSNVITQLVLDKKGKLWIGTDNGLNSFHKGQWKHIYPNSKNKYINALALRHNPSTNEDEVFTTLCAKKDKDCLEVERFSDGSVASRDFSFHPLIKKSDYVYFRRTTGTEIQSLAVSTKQKLFVGSNKFGINIIDLLDLSSPTVHLLRTHNVSAILPNFYKAALFGTTEGRIFSGNGLYWYLPEEKKGFWLAKHFEHFFDSANISALAKDGKNLYVGMANNYGRNGLVRILFKGKTQPENGNLKFYQNKVYENMGGNSIKKIVIGKRIVLIIDGRKEYRSHVWTASRIGLSRYIPDLTAENEGIWESAQFQSNSTKNLAGLASDEINNLAYDHKNDTLWVGTNGDGLTRLKVQLLE